VTTGGGGAIVTNDRDLARFAKHITTTAKLPHQWAITHDQTGFNYRMPNINAAIGCAQLEQLDAFLTAKRDLALYYHQALAYIDGVNFFVEPYFAKSNYWLNAILLDDEFTVYRDEILTALHSAGILARPAWTLMHNLEMYSACPKMELTIAEAIESKLINLPSGAALIKA
jgi:perosamine synthetase